MKYFSLNHDAPEVSFREAVIQGIAPDGGLYFPVHIPPFPKGFFDTAKARDLVEIGLHCMQHYTGADIGNERLEWILREVLDFSFPIVPLDDRIGSLELFHGPTLAFKDVGARFMARCLGTFSETRDQAITVLVATSGDTGGAVANGFLGVEGVEVVILYPRGKVSDIQERQLTTLGRNITALEVEGSFDDCQAMVKTAFVDPDYRGKRSLTSANSINVARWLPQMIYFVHASFFLREKGMKTVYSVPSGNFGNICAGLMGWKMGMPAGHFIAATNENDTIPRYMKSGRIEPSPTRPTLSNAMDVSNPSNFVRILRLFHEERTELQEVFSSVSFDDEATLKAIREIYRDHGYVADPHGAIGFLALRDFLYTHTNARGVFLETAHPVKFIDTVESALGRKVPLPESVQELLTREKVSTRIANYGQFKEFLLS